MIIPKKTGPIDFKGPAGMMLRGKKVYGLGGTTPNPTGRNTQRIAKSLLDKRKNSNGS